MLGDVPTLGHRDPGAGFVDFARRRHRADGLFHLPKTLKRTCVRGRSALRRGDVPKCISHQITITVSDEVYQGLQDRTISELFEELARPIANDSSLEASYREMTLDGDREREAAELIEGLVHDSLPAGLDRQ